MSDCQLCPLSRERNRLVFGGGNPEAKMMIIGEAPGYEENLKGDKFVGKSGQIPDQIAYVSQAGGSPSPVKTYKDKLVNLF